MYPKLHIYEEYSPSHKYFFSVDTRSGSGRDDSCLVVWNGTTESISASFTDNNTKMDELCNIISTASTLYQPKLIFIEKNGIGFGTIAMCRERGLPVVEHKTDNANRYVGYLKTRNKIIGGLAADEHLVENCLSCVVEESGNDAVKFTGRKDFLSALSFLFSNENMWREEITKPPERIIPPGHFDGLKFLQQGKRRKF
jgi:hypothetical protein